MMTTPVDASGSGSSRKGRRPEGSVSTWLRNQVQLCMYVQELDVQRDQDPTFVCDSHRKVTWKQQRHLRRLEELEHQEHGDLNSNPTAPVHDHDANKAEATKSTSDQLQDGNANPRDDEIADSNDEPFDLLVGQVLRGNDVDVTCEGSLTVRASDQHGAISVPCVREGNSLTLCCSAAIGEQLLVFGGRILQDAAILLPRAVRADPMKLERARYAYSNAVYALDVATHVWTRHECSGREPRERSDHSALFLAPSHLLVFGGRGRHGQVLRDLFALSLEHWHWTQLETETPPLERYWHAWCLAFDTEQPWRQEPSVFLFGGKSDTFVYGDLQQLPTDRVKRQLAEAEQEGLQLYCARDRKGQGLEAADPHDSEGDDVLLLRKDLESRWKPEWLVPHTVGKPPAKRFGMQIIALENEQLAVVGGWRVDKKKKGQAPRPLDVHILDLTTLVWSTPRLSTLVCAQPFVPSERMLFECFYVHHTLVLFGGHSYASDGETEAFTACADATNAVYKLDVGRMIWRRQEFPAAAGRSLPAAHAHSSSNAVLGGRSFTCASCPDSLELQLTAFQVEAPKS